ncbi:MAG TPA: sensor histidine kinase [Flavobacteriales bacterium]|nr:sensor histidine kinase [Flavobacteriales bacterium]
MTGRKLIDRSLPALIAAVLLLAGWLLWRHHRATEQRAQDLVGLDILRAQQMLAVRVDAMFHEWQEDAIEESAAIAERIDEDHLIQRWKALLHSHWPMIAVRLADEFGNETSLYRNDDGLMLVRTVQSSIDTVPMAYAVTDDGIDSIGQPLHAFGHYDPRERIWFSKALENSREVPVWGERQFGDSVQRVVQVSNVIRGGQSDQGFRVLLIDIDLGRAAAIDSRTPSMIGNGILLINGDGRVYASNRAASEEPMAVVLSQALPLWLARKFNKAIHIEHAGRPYAVQVSPVHLNGCQLYTVVGIDATPHSDLTASDRQASIIAAMVVVALAILLALLAWRGRQRRRAAGLLELQTRQLQHRFNKALGERDVLSREVHHRVKNNLQVVSSLLNLQASSLDDPHVRDEFLRGKRRIDTIALVHHRLYDQPDLRDISLGSFLRQLTDSIAAMHGEMRTTVSIGVTTNGLKCDQDTAIELGIIVCELVNNAYQHAFPHATGGHIAITASNVEGDLYRLVVSNNGVPPANGNLSGPGKLGLEIVEALAEQLDGSLHMRTEGHAAFEVLFRMRRPAASAEAYDTHGV